MAAPPVIAPGFFSRNWQLKASALGLSILLWTLVRLDALGSDSVSLPVDVALADGDWAVVSGPDPAQVEVQFAGPVGDFVNLLIGGSSVSIPIDDVVSSDTIVFMRKEWVQVGAASGLDVVGITPASVRIAFQRMQESSRPVATRFTGALPESLALTEPIRVDPAVVQVRGPSGMLAARDSIFLQPFDLSRVRMTDTVVIAFDTTGLEGMTLADSSVQLRFHVEPAVTQVLGDVPVAINGAPEATDLVANPRSVTVELIGAASVIDALDTSELVARVDLSGRPELEEGEQVELAVELRGVSPLVRFQVVPARIEVRRERRR